MGNNLLCNIGSLMPSANDFVESFSSFTDSMGQLLRSVFEKIANTLSQISLSAYLEQTASLQRQVMSISPFGRTPNTRIKLRSMLGLSALYQDNPDGIKQLSGSIQWVAKGKICSRRLIVSMRDNDE